MNRQRIAALRAALAGRIARRNGLPVTACPFDPEGDAAQRFQARYWIRGWNRTTAP